MLDSLPLFENTVIAILALVVLLAITFRFSSQSRRGKYPPGPPGNLFTGHLRQITSTTPHFYYKELNDHYGTMNCTTFSDAISIA